MKYLAHSADASYDAPSKTWTFDLGRRVGNPTSLVLSKACFSVPTHYEPPPHVVYLRRRPSPRQPLARRVLLCPHESPRQPTARPRTRALRPPSLQRIGFFLLRLAVDLSREYSPL